MNAIFTVIMISSSLMLCICAPDELLPAALSGVEEALACALTLTGVYAVWMGLSAVAEDCRLTQKAAKILAPACRKIFRTDDKEAVENLSMNVSCNLLGLGGAATPYGIKAIKRLGETGNEFAQNLLFVINSTSIQLLPTTVITLRAAAGSAAAYDIVIPSLIATFVSTFTGATLYSLYYKLKTLWVRKKCSI